MKDLGPGSYQESWRTGLEITPQYDAYENETPNKNTFCQLTEELDSITEVGNHYIGAEILLPRGNKMARSHVVACSWYARGSMMGRAHTNSILDTRMYQVKFAGGEVTKLIRLVYRTDH